MTDTERLLLEALDRLKTVATVVRDDADEPAIAIVAQAVLNVARDIEHELVDDLFTDITQGIE